MERPEHLDFLISISHAARHDTEYKISFRAWQLKALRDYIVELERKVERHGE